MPELTNRDVIRMHLEIFVQNHPDQSWATLMAYCTGYYEKIDLDIISVIWDMQTEGLIE